METSIVFAVMLIAIAVVFPNTNALPTIDAEDKRESNFATRDVNFPLQDVSYFFFFTISRFSRSLIYLTIQVFHETCSLF